VKFLYAEQKVGSTEKSLISRKAAKAQREISWFRQGKVAETPSFLLLSLSPLLIPAFFSGEPYLFLLPGVDAGAGRMMLVAVIMSFILIQGNYFCQPTP